MLENTVYKVDFEGDGVTTRFDFDDFSIYDGDHLAVYVDTVLQTSGYTVTLDSSTDLPSVGYVTFDSAPDDGAVIVLKPEPPLTQTLNHINNQQTSASLQNRALDLIVQNLQNLQEQLNRCVKSDIETDEPGDAIDWDTIIGEGSIAASMLNADVTTLIDTRAALAVAAISSFATLSVTTLTVGSLTATSIAGALNGIVGGVTPAAGTFTTLAATTIDGIIGSVTPAAGTFTGLTVNNNSTDHGLLVSQIGVLATGKHCIHAYSGGAQTNADSAVVKIDQDNASSTEPALEFQNDGSAPTIYDDTGAHLTVGGVWTDAPSTYATKSDIKDLDIAGFCEKLKRLRLRSFIKNSEKKRLGANSPRHNGYILDDENTPDELVAFDWRTGKLDPEAGLSAQRGVAFLLAVGQEIINRLEKLEANYV